MFGIAATKCKPGKSAFDAFVDFEDYVFNGAESYIKSTCYFVSEKGNLVRVMPGTLEYVKNVLSASGSSLPVIAEEEEDNLSGIGSLERDVGTNPSGYAFEYNERMMKGETFPALPTIHKRGTDHMPIFYAWCGTYVATSKVKKFLNNYLKGYVMNLPMEPMIGGLDETIGCDPGLNNTISIFKHKPSGVSLLSMPGIEASCVHSAYVFYHNMLHNQIAECHKKLLTQFKSKTKYDIRTYPTYLQTHADVITRLLKDRGYISAVQTPPRMSPNGMLWEQTQAIADCLKIAAVNVPELEKLSELKKVDSIIVHKRHAYLYLPSTNLYDLMRDVHRWTVVMDGDVDDDSNDDLDVNTSVDAVELFVEAEIAIDKVMAPVDLEFPLPVEAAAVIAATTAAAAVKRGKVITFKRWGTNFHVNFDISVNFNYGFETKKLIAQMYPEVREFPKLYAKLNGKPYGHPFVRTVADQKFVDVINALYRLHHVDFTKVTVVDIGAKIHKTDDLTNGSIKKKLFKYLAYRPKLTAYDEAYYIKNAEYVDMLIDKAVHAGTIDDGNFIICIDAIWYPGVKEYIATRLNAIPGAVAHVVFTAYPSQNGTYETFDREATAVIKDGFINYQAGNNVKYTHEHFYWPSVDSSDAVLEFSGKRVAIHEMSRTAVGPQLSIVHTVWTSTKQPLSQPDFDQMHSYVDIFFEDMTILQSYKGIADSYDLGTYNRKVKVLRSIVRSVDVVSVSNTVAKDPMNLYSTAMRNYVNEGKGSRTADTSAMMHFATLARVHELDSYKAKYAVLGDNDHAKLVKSLKDADKPPKERLIIAAADFAVRTLTKIFGKTKAISTVNKTSLDGIGGFNVIDTVKQKVVNFIVGDERERLTLKHNDLYVIAHAINEKATIAIDTVNVVTVSILAGCASLYVNMPIVGVVIVGVSALTLLFNGYAYLKMTLLLNSFAEEDRLEVYTALLDKRINKLMVAYDDMAGSYVRHVDDSLLEIKPSDLGEQAVLVTFMDPFVQNEYVNGRLTAELIPCTCKVDNYEATMPVIIANGAPYECFYYDGCARNGVAALLTRQLQNCPRGDPRWFAQFYDWYVKRIDKLLEQAEMLELNFTFEEYLSTRKPEKAKKYAAAADEVLQTGIINDNLNFFVKTGEAKYDSGKPRAIMATHRTGSGYALYFNWILKKIFGKLLPGLVFDMNCADLSDRLTEDLEHVPNNLDIEDSSTGIHDKQNHDAHQNGLIMSTHNYAINKFEPLVCRVGNIPDIIRPELLRFMENVTHKAFYQLDGVLYMIVVFKNTVASGLGVHTTTGNSVWVHMTNEYISYQAGLVYDDVWYNVDTNCYRYGKNNDVYNYTHGDDSMMKIVRGARKLIRVVASTFSIDNNSAMKGTGESIKGFKMLPFDYSDFLSLHSIRLPSGQFVFFRQLHKALLIKPRKKHLEYYEHLYSIYMAYCMWGKNVPMIDDMILYMRQQLDACINADGTLGYSPSPKKRKQIEAYLDSYDVAMLKTHAHLIDTSLVIEMWERVYHFRDVCYNVSFDGNFCNSEVFNHLYNRIGGETFDTVDYVDLGDTVHEAHAMDYTVHEVNAMDAANVHHPDDTVLYDSSLDGPLDDSTVDINLDYLSNGESDCDLTIQAGGRHVVVDGRTCFLEPYHEQPIVCPITIDCSDVSDYENEYLVPDTSFEFGKFTGKPLFIDRTGLTHSNLIQYNRDYLQILFNEGDMSTIINNNVPRQRRTQKSIAKNKKNAARYQGAISNQQNQNQNNNNNTFNAAKIAKNRRKNLKRKQRKAALRFGAGYAPVYGINHFSYRNAGQNYGPQNYGLGGINTSTARGNPVKYVANVLDPAGAEPCRVPTEFPIKTALTKFNFEGTFNTNVNGDFSLVAFPSNMVGDVLIVLNDDTYDPNTATQAAPPTILEVGTNKLSNSQYSYSRVVGCCMRVWNTNARNYTNGNAVTGYVGRVPPNLYAISPSTSFIEYDLMNEGIGMEIAKVNDKHQVLWRPRDAADLTFVSNNVDPNLTTCLVYNGYNQKNTNTGAATRIKYELYLTLEYIITGANTQSEESIGSSDMRGRNIAGAILANNPTLAVHALPKGGGTVPSYVNSILSMLDESIDRIPIEEMGRKAVSIVSSGNTSMYE